MKKKYSEDGFHTSAHNIAFYSSKLQELLDSSGIKSYKDSVGTIGFTGTRNKYQVNLAKTFEEEVFGAIYFDGVNPPKKINILEPEIILFNNAQAKN